MAGLPMNLAFVAAALLAIAIIALSLMAFYLVAKAAVRNGVIEARSYAVHFSQFDHPSRYLKPPRGSELPTAVDPWPDFAQDNEWTGDR